MPKAKKRQVKVQDKAPARDPKGGHHGGHPPHYIQGGGGGKNPNRHPRHPEQ